MSDTAPDKWRCDYWRCAWVGTLDQALSAPDPFTEGKMIYACPHCRDPNNLVRACDIEGCNEKSTCGTPVPDARRYVSVCGEHFFALRSSVQPPAATSTAPGSSSATDGT